MLTKREIRVKFLAGLIVDRRDETGNGKLIIVPQGAVGTVKGFETVQHGGPGPVEASGPHYHFVVAVDWALVEHSGMASQVEPVTVDVELGDVEQFGIVETPITVTRKPLVSIE